VKPRTVLLIVLAAVVLVCGLPVMAVLTTTTPAAACAPGAGGSGSAVNLRTHVGPVGEFKSGQVDNAAIIVAVGADQNSPSRGWVIAVATAMAESRLINTRKVTDHDSVGLFQQRPSQGWGTPEQLIDPVYTSKKFYAALLKVDKWETLPLTVAAQKVQRSAYPDRYAKFETIAEEVVAKVAGVASITDLPGASHAICDQTPVVAAGGWTQPVHAKVGSGFRTPDRPRHQGVDMMAARNTVIRAASAGKVVWANCDASTGNCDVDGSIDNSRGCGWFVEILHADGIASRYCHMIRKPDVTNGQTVKAGDPLGLVGSSGHSSGPHLHFEIHHNITCGNTRCGLSSTNAISPIDWMKKVGAPLGD
jgi:murein DD-endopeptidase MepM/ murein hydrolase activator NlpD